MGNVKYLTSAGTLTMRSVFLLAACWLAALLPLQHALAQDVSFSGYEVVQLAYSITDAAAKQPYTLPSAYLFTRENQRTAVINAPNAFELLARAIIAWRADPKNKFPEAVSLQMLDLKGPAPAPDREPTTPGMTIAVPSADVGDYAQIWLDSAKAKQNTLPKAVTFPGRYQLTAAQFEVAMAALINEAYVKREIPRAVAMPQVLTPRDWLAIDQPLPVVAGAKPGKDPIDIDTWVNDIMLSESGPVNFDGPVPPFCGSIRIKAQGHGPVANIRLLLDNNELRTFKGAGPHTFELNSLPLPDGQHMIAATATGTEDQTVFSVFSFTVRNGRVSSFTPAELTAAVPNTSTPTR